MYLSMGLCMNVVPSENRIGYYISGSGIRDSYKLMWVLELISARGASALNC